jgi:hypothetical protein
MKKWGKFIPIVVQLAGIVTLVLTGIAAIKWR